MELHRIYLGTFVFINCLLIVSLINFERHQNYKIDMSKNISVNNTKHQENHAIPCPRILNDSTVCMNLSDIRPGDFKGRSGQIQAALNLEIPDNSIKYFNIKIEGLNGQLPNLDLVNLVVRLCHKHHIDVMLHDTVSETSTGVNTKRSSLLLYSIANPSNCSL